MIKLKLIMVESSKHVTSLLPFPRIPSRLGSAVLIQYLGYKHKVTALMKCLSKGSAQYVQDAEHVLDQFWDTGKRVKFSEDWLGIDRSNLVEEKSPFVTSVFPPPET